MRSLAAHLEQTSRTFALSIPLLPEDLRRPVTVAYLLFRIADTIEDELEGPAELRAAALRLVAERFEADPGSLAEALGERSRTTLASEVAHDGYADLIEAAPDVLKAFLNLPQDERAIIARHLARTARGMADFLGRDLSGGSASDLRAYCYAVAGIVGEMLTELFALRDAGAARVSSDLTRDAAAFGEGLQLVNIVRDASDDLHAGRCYLPRSLGRAELMAMARAGFEGAERYAAALERAGAAAGIVAFNALNAVLAVRTLRLVEAEGPGAKLSREEVAGLVSEIRAGMRPGAGGIARLLTRELEAGEVRTR